MITIILAVIGAIAILAAFVRAADNGSTFAQAVVCLIVFAGIPAGIFALIA